MNNKTAGETVVTDPREHQTSYRFDQLGRLTEVEDHLGGKASSTYNDDGFVTSTTDQATETAHFGRDELNNVIHVQLPSGVTHDAEYEAEENPHYPSMARNSQSSWVDITYSDSGRLTSRSNQLPSNNQFLVDINADGTVKKTTDGMGNQTDYSYFSNGDLQTISRPLGVGDMSFTYDALSRVKTATDAEGHTTTYTYDVMDRVTRIDFAGGDYIVNTYDAGGRLQRRDDVVGGQLSTTTFGYDALNRQTTKSVPGATYTSTYDPAGNLDTLSGPGGTVDYHYDEVNRLSGLTEPGGTTTFGYDDAYRRNLISYPNGVTQTTNYDPDCDDYGRAIALRI